VKSYIQRLYISQPRDWEPALGSQPLGALRASGAA
jgi:hypothetical protein